MSNFEHHVEHTGGSIQCESESHFKVLEAYMERWREDMLRQMNEELCSAASDRAPVPPLTRRERLKYAYGRSSRYFSTLWDALSGRDPYDVDY